MKLTDKIHILRVDFEIALSPEKKLSRFVNVMLIFGARLTLIDTGVKGSEKLIFDYIRQNNRDFSEIDTIILSHSHPDHIGSAARIKELTGCRVLSHSAEKEWIENIEIQNTQRPVPGFFSLVDHSVKIDGFLSDNQEIQIEKGITLKIIHSPGHSRGSINVLFKESRILFTADSVPLKNDIPKYDSYMELMKSLAFISENKQYDVLLTSWTPPLTEKQEITRLLAEGEEYMKKIDLLVKNCYNPENSVLSDPCKSTIEKLGLPPFLAVPLVDKAFRSHYFTQPPIQ